MKMPTTQQFVDYFRKYPPNENQLKMMLLHYLSPEKTLTAGIFSKYMGWPATQSSANLHYGTYAGKVAKQMGFLIPLPPHKISFFVKFDSISVGDDKFLTTWIMRPAFASAIKELGWGTEKRLEDVGSDIGYDLVTEDTEFEGSINYVQEGKRELRQHYVRERNPKIIKAAKSLAKRKFGELRCVVCNFSFGEIYGDRVIDYIEAHHKIPISEMKSGDKTNVGDIALVCANCHRTIHAKWPIISVSDLKKIIKK